MGDALHYYYIGERLDTGHQPGSKELRAYENDFAKACHLLHLMGVEPHSSVIGEFKR